MGKLNRSRVIVERQPRGDYLLMFDTGEVRRARNQAEVQENVNGYSRDNAAANGWGDICTIEWRGVKRLRKEKP